MNNLFTSINSNFI